jgi:hypothetical protein
MMDPSFWKWLAGLAATAWAAIISWNWRRVVATLDRVQKEKANKESTDARFAELRGDISVLLAKVEAHDLRDRAAHEELQSEIAKTNITLARIEGKLDG